MIDLSLSHLIFNLWLIILVLQRLYPKGQFFPHDVVLDCLFPESPITGDPVKSVQREEAVAEFRYELDGGENEPELLCGEVVSKTQPCPSWLQSTVSLKSL